jgi:hypothetical protein
VIGSTGCRGQAASSDGWNFCAIGRVDGHPSFVSSRT